MTLLNQIIAVEKGERTAANRAWTDLYKAIQRHDLFNGLTRTYQPVDEEGEQRPAETKTVQLTAAKASQMLRSCFLRLLDVTATKDWANTTAKADIVLDGQTLVADVPVTYLIWLEKQLVDLQTFVDHLPVLDPSETWTHDPAVGQYRSADTVTNSSKKVLRNHVKAEPTVQHPAQVEVYTEDQVVGRWTATKFSGAITQERREELLERAAKLVRAVKFAREQANTAQVEDKSVGAALFDYLLA